MKFTKLALMLLLVQTMVFIGCSKDNKNNQSDDNAPVNDSAAGQKLQNKIQEANNQANLELEKCITIYKAIKKFRKKYNKIPKSVNQLIETKILSTLPKSQFNAEFKIKPFLNGCIVVGGKGVEYPSRVSQNLLKSKFETMATIEYSNCKAIHKAAIQFYIINDQKIPTVKQLFEKGLINIIPKSIFKAKYEIIKTKNGSIVVKGGRGVQFPPKNS